MASSGIPLDTGALISAVLEGILYGFSVLMFMGTIWSLTSKRQVQDINRCPIVVVATLLLLLSTAHMVATIIRLEDGFVKYRDTYPGGPVAFFADVSQGLYVIKHALYVLQTLLADGVVVYRCYVVWQSVRVIILPSMLWCGVAVTGVYGVWNGSQYDSVFVPELMTWILGFFISTIAANALSSGLMAYRIWAIEHSITTVRASTQGTMMPIARVLIDAAVLYSVALLITLICFICSNNGEYVMLDLVMPIISIAFYMVLIRIAMNRNYSYRYLSAVGTTAEMEQGNLQKYPTIPLQVHISRFMCSDGTSAYGIGSDHQRRSSPRALTEWR
ncbi:hypothetical protein DFJ58DRAFT_476131 [Suillus subalutaceus]|uniref:uncharacterized protein n=1 Tax=Suillus subalutaceus TaxID=48586 RepID=UPI001B87BAF7|nr:uncharacterized protein DFJ58DRAFT_476131 [Suillus subalutaceus]KAG1848098.1 hypothetical protein DFJ58DRAFT_476131 [Suillus subalutaceus]